ncbi:ATP-binding cassette domain-containing protein [Anaerococcus sp. Marseille-P9784]|uniref:ATP-binding cassette domain-containing protein n=1 Tax=Anaerococcus sp. Marseille-P9784 TaxID=2614127 RepID=UPI001249D74D|nr:ABC transporter ATP-binding protein [Anaerococcus sp. Marseille-P9784]
MIKINNLSKTYGNKLVLENVNLEIKEGKVYGLIGRNGAGKTTLMKVLSDQIINYQGEIYYKGTNILLSNQLKKNLIYIGEDFLTYNLKEKKLIKTVNYIKKLYPKFNQERFDELSALFKIDLLAKYKKLSYGNQSLFRNIIALSLQAQFLLLDEPSTGLDEINRDLFYGKLIEYQEIDNSTVIISSHILSDIEKIVTDLLILNEGKIIVNDPIDELLEKAFVITINAENLHFFASKNIIKKSNIGKQIILYVYDSFSNDEMRKIKEIADIKRLNLKELFLALTKED